MHKKPIGRFAWYFWLIVNIAFAVFMFLCATGMYVPEDGWNSMKTATGFLMLAVSVVLFLMRRPESAQEKAERSEKVREAINERKKQSAALKEEREENNRYIKERKAQREQEWRENGYATSSYKGPKCPRCGSIEFQVLGNDGKPLSAGKALVGDMIAGPSGAIIGAAMGKKGKYQALCSKCGKRFEFK